MREQYEVPTINLGRGYKLLGTHSSVKAEVKDADTAIHQCSAILVTQQTADEQWREVNGQVKLTKLVETVSAIGQVCAKTSAYNSVIITT